MWCAGYRRSGHLGDAELQIHRQLLPLLMLSLRLDTRQVLLDGADVM